jgi:hypothetical protein
MYLSHRKSIKATTQSFINEFFSREFLSHRIAISGLREKVIAGEVMPSDIAAGYWYPGISEEHSGETYDGLTEHQHLEAYLGFVVRLSHADSRGQIDRQAIRSALRTSYLWHADLSTCVADEATKQVARAKMSDVPVWIEAVRRVNEIMNYEHDDEVKKPVCFDDCEPSKPAQAA